MVSNSLVSVGNNFAPAHGHQYVKLSSGLPNNSLQQAGRSVTQYDEIE